MNKKVAIGGIVLVGIAAVAVGITATPTAVGEQPAPIEVADAIDAGTVFVAACGVPVCHVALVKDGRTKNLAALANGAPVPAVWLTIYDVHVFAPGTDDERTYTLPPMWGREGTP